MTILKISNTRWHTSLTNLSHSIFQHYVKIVQIWSIFWSVFSCIRTEHRKYGPENTPYLDIFHAVQRICLYILMDILKYTLTVVLYYKIMNLYNKVLITFSWCNSATKRYQATFMWYCNIYYIWQHFAY